MSGVVALVEIVFFTGMRNSGKLSPAAYPLLVLASAFLPIVVYAIFAWIVPELGAREIF